MTWIDDRTEIAQKEAGNRLGGEAKPVKF